MLNNHIIKIPKLEFVGGVDRHSTWKLSFLRWGGRGEGRGVDRPFNWKLSFLRWGGRGGEGRGGEGGESTLNLEVVIS